MQEEHRKAIQNIFGSLVEQTDLDSMVSALYEKGVFSEQMIEPYRNKNKDVRQRKRELYNDITRRGPHAFQHLLDTLSELGYWGLVRDLDPDSPYHPQTHFKPQPLKPESSSEEDPGFVSLSDSKVKSRKKPPIAPVVADPAPKPIVDEPVPEDLTTPDLEVKKSTKFFEDNGHDIKVYRTRGKRRGYLLMLNYVTFAQNSETHRKGVQVDCRKLKQLFEKIGFTVESHMNLTKQETIQTLENLKIKLVEDWESLFIVVSSHGYKKDVDGETDIRCSDLKLISDAEIINHFSNKNFPQLNGIPKVFIFQVCRGTNEDYDLRCAKDSTPVHPNVETTNMPIYNYDSVTRDGQASIGGVPINCTRLYSDILIAHSTLPGFVSYRDEEAGSWYIQSVCEVFAERAHDCDVFTLFTLVDKKLEARYKIQTSTIESRGFRRLYLHPGLFEDDA